MREAEVSNDPTGSKWNVQGVRVVRANELDIYTAQTPGMNRAAAITPRSGAEKLRDGTVVIQAEPNKKRRRGVME